MKARFILFLFTFSCFLLPLAHGGFSFLHAQWSTDPSQNLQVSPWGLSPQACTDGDGGVYIAWESFDYYESKVYLQRVDRFGYVQWQPPLLIGELGNFQEAVVKVAPDGNGNALVAYTQLTPVDTSGPTTFYEGKILVQKVDAQGNTLWPGEGVRVSLDSTDQGSVELVPDSAGGAIVLWKERKSIWADTIRLYIQRVSPTGQRLWGTNGLLIAENITTENPHLVADGFGGAIAGWNHLKIQRISASGQFIWNQNGINVGIYFNSQMLSNQEGGVIIGGTRLVGIDIGIFTQHVAFDGNLLWNPQGVLIADSLHEPIGQKIKFDFKENFDQSVTYVWSVFSDTSVFLKAQRLDLLGNFLWNPNGHSVTDTISSQHYPAIVNSDLGTNIIIWQDSRNGNSEYAQKLNVDGLLLWSGDRIISTRFFIYKHVVSDQKGGAIVVWSEDPVNGIYAQQISRNGNLGEVIITEIKNGKNLHKVKEFKLQQNYPNPFNNYTTIPYIITMPGKTTITIYNMGGQKIREFNLNHLQPGNYEITWDGRNEQGESLSSGVYLYRLKTLQGYSIRKLIYLK